MLLLGEAKAAPCVEDLGGQSLGHWHRVVAQEFDALGSCRKVGGWTPRSQFPIDSTWVPIRLATSLPAQVKLQSPPFDVLTNGLRGGWCGLGANPTMGMRATQSLDLQMAKWQRTKRLASPSCGWIPRCWVGLLPLRDGDCKCSARFRVAIHLTVVPSPWHCGGA